MPLASVYERDGYVCQLCGHIIDPALVAPHPRSKSIDHVVPLSRGGPHVFDNLQTACFICNSLKGDRVDAQVVGRVNL